MTEGERYVSTLPGVDRFHDRNKRWSYDLARRTGERLVDAPGLVGVGRDFLERHVRDDPHQRPYYDMWSRLLDEDVREVVRQLLEDSPRGDILRDTQPVFLTLTPEERTGIFAGSRARHSRSGPQGMGA